MKVKITDLVQFQNSYKEIQNEKMPINLAYSLSKIAKEVEENTLFYQQRYNSYLEDYAEKEENGDFKTNSDKTGFILKEETIKEAHAKFNELDKFEFIIEAPLIPLSKLESLQLSPSILEGLLPFIEAE